MSYIYINIYIYYNIYILHRSHGCSSMSLFVAFDNFIFNEFLCGFQMLIYKLRIQLSLKMFGQSSNQSIETVLRRNWIVCMSILITFQPLFLLRMLHDKNFKKYTHGIPIKLSADIIQICFKNRTFFN